MKRKVQLDDDDYYLRMVDRARQPLLRSAEERGIVVSAEIIPRFVEDGQNFWEMW